MDMTQFLKTRVPPATKERVRAAAEREYLTESNWCRRVIEQALQGPESNKGVKVQSLKDGREHELERYGAGERLYVRLRPDDRLLLRERSAARGMPAATYTTVLLRSHLRNLAPLPKDELAALKRSVTELSAIGRNLNQIARATHHPGQIVGPSREDLRVLLKVCEALRGHVKDLIKANVTSWSVGHAEH